MESVPQQTDGGVIAAREVPSIWRLVDAPTTRVLLTCLETSAAKRRFAVLSSENHGSTVYCFDGFRGSGTAHPELCAVIAAATAAVGGPSCIVVDREQQSAWACLMRDAFAFVLKNA